MPSDFFKHQHYFVPKYPRVLPSHDPSSAPMNSGSHATQDSTEALISGARSDPSRTAPATAESQAISSSEQGWKLSVAPMIDVTDRHSRYFHRLLTPHARLYTEMVTTRALMYGSVSRHLDFNDQEHPVALQLGGSDPYELAHCAKLGERWGYDEINLNCGCPSDRVQKGAFGACLMGDPKWVATCMLAMQEAVTVPVTVKHRLGIDDHDSYEFVRDFVGTLHAAGCRVFIVHARIAILKGLSPKDNREIPPLRYDDAARLKVDFPDATFVLNGGLNSLETCDAEIGRFDGVMLGRAAWHDPRVLSRISQAWWPDSAYAGDDVIIRSMTDYAAQEMKKGVPLRVVVRPLLGLFSGWRGARIWRQKMSDARWLDDSGPEVIMSCWEALKQQNTVFQDPDLSSGQSRM